MKKLEQIKNDYAKVQHYDNWDSLLNKQESLANIEWHYNNIIELAQMECLKLASESATMKVEYPDECYSDSNEYGAKFVNAHDVECGGEYGFVEIEKDSITNENN